MTSSGSRMAFRFRGNPRMIAALLCGWLVIGLGHKAVACTNATVPGGNITTPTM